MESDFKPAKRSAKSFKTAAPQAKTDTEVFRTPDEIAAGQSLDAPSARTLPEVDIVPKPDRPKSGWKERLALHWPPGKKEYITAVVVVLLAGAGMFALAQQDAKPQPVAKQAQKSQVKVVKPKTVPSTLSGLPVDPSLNARPVTGVMIENSPGSRPQSGLGDAGVVFEAIAEGGITRFLALYQDTAPGSVGPIRSARPYYAQWVLGFDAGYAHVGGSPQALADIRAWGVRDLDQFANGGSYQRIASRAAPHNVYTSIAALHQLEASKGWNSSNFTGFARKPKETPSKKPDVKGINLTISGPSYGVHYTYNSPTNSYNRTVGGAPHVDANTNTQISPKVIVAMVMPYSLAADGYHSNYATIGSGPVYIFQDGTLTTGQWTKAANASQFTFADAAGKPIKLNPGQTWLTVVGNPGNVAYAAQ
ncbi:MAG TPA: DUF3048 domain-containing protein [Candidatus Saccharimonadales bacterium]|nr:DUF3048 domain-containing protein [Candidatus Saccharimonadales bacterium]